MAEIAASDDPSDLPPSLQPVMARHDLTSNTGVWGAVAGYVEASRKDDNSRYSWRVGLHDQIASLAKAAYAQGMADGAAPVVNDADATLSRAEVVSGLYGFLLGRAPDPEGLDVFCQHMREGLQVEGVAAAIADSEEFKTNLNRFFRSIYAR